MKGIKQLEVLSRHEVFYKDNIILVEFARVQISGPPKQLFFYSSFEAGA